jgi:hypothetical protein
MIVVNMQLTARLVTLRYRSAQLALAVLCHEHAVKVTGRQSVPSEVIPPVLIWLGF